MSEGELILHYAEFGTVDPKNLIPRRQASVLACFKLRLAISLKQSTSPTEYNPIKTLKTSTLGTVNMLGLAKRVRARILFTSTSEVYGDPKENPQKESYWGNVNPIGPRACYDEVPNPASPGLNGETCRRNPQLCALNRQPSSPDP